MKLYRDETIVLRIHDLGEADQIITSFSRRHGKIRGVARGVQRMKSRFGAWLGPFFMVDLQLYEGRTLDVITGAATFDPYGCSIGRDHDVYVYAYVITEVVDELAAIKEEPDQAHYLLLHEAIHALATSVHRPTLIVDSYVLRAMSLYGWGLPLYKYAVCRRGGGLATLHLQSGGAACSGYAPRVVTYPALKTIELLGSLASDHWDIVGVAAEHDWRAAPAIVGTCLQ